MVLGEAGGWCCPWGPYVLPGPEDSSLASLRMLERWCPLSKLCFVPLPSLPRARAEVTTGSGDMAWLVDSSTHPIWEGVFVTFSFPPLCSVLESDPQFGFEEAKRKLQGRAAQRPPSAGMWGRGHRGQRSPSELVGGEGRSSRSRQQADCIPVSHRAALARGLLQQVASEAEGTRSCPDLCPGPEPALADREAGPQGSQDRVQGMDPRGMAPVPPVQVLGHLLPTPT